MTASSGALVSPTRPAVRVDRTQRDDGTVELVARVRPEPDNGYQHAHFPGRPIYPGVFLLEALRHVLVEASARGDQPGPEPFDLLAVESVRFVRPVLPDDDIDIAVLVRPGVDHVARAQARFTVAGRRCAQATVVVPW